MQDRIKIYNEELQDRNWGIHHTRKIGNAPNLVRQFKTKITPGTLWSEWKAV
jgi:hypothetical protein